MTLDKQVKAQYDYWFEKKPNPGWEKEKPGNHHTYSVKPEFLSDTIDTLKRLAKSRASMIVQEYFGNKATNYEDALRRDHTSHPPEPKSLLTVGEILAGGNKKHHNSFLEEVIKEKFDFSYLLMTVRLYQPINQEADFVISLPCNLSDMYPPPSHALEKTLALAGLSDMQEFLKSGEECDISNMKPYGYTPHGHGLEIKLIDKSDMESIVAKAVAQSYEVLFEHYKGKDVSRQIDQKAALLRRMQELMIDFAKNDAIPEDRQAPVEQNEFKSELVNLVESERQRSVVFLFNQKEVSRMELPVFATENDSIIIDIAKKDEAILKAIGYDHFVNDVQIVLKTDEVVVCTVSSDWKPANPEPEEAQSEDPVLKDIKTEFSKVPAGRRLESEKRRQAYESFKTKWSDDPGIIEDSIAALNKELRTLKPINFTPVTVKEAFEEMDRINRKQDTSDGQETSS